jgi:hypothetical protein
LQLQDNLPAPLSPAAAAAAAGGGFGGLGIDVDMMDLMDQGLMSPGSPGFGGLGSLSPRLNSAAAAAAAAAAGGEDSPLRLQSPAAAATAAEGSSSGDLREEWERDHVHPNPAMGVGHYRLAVTGSQLKCGTCTADTVDGHQHRCKGYSKKRAFSFLYYPLIDVVVHDVTSQAAASTRGSTALHAACAFITVTVTWFRPEPRTPCEGA